jgi:hypothetical protein
MTKPLVLMASTVFSLRKLGISSRRIFIGYAGTSSLIRLISRASIPPILLWYPRGITLSM